VQVCGQRGCHLQQAHINKTFADFNYDYQIWTNNVKELLEKKRKSL